MKQRYFIMYEECEDEYQVIDRAYNCIEMIYHTYEQARWRRDELNEEEGEWTE